MRLQTPDPEARTLVLLLQRRGHLQRRLVLDDPSERRAFDTHVADENRHRAVLVVDADQPPAATPPRSNPYPRKDNLVHISPLLVVVGQPHHPLARVQEVPCMVESVEAHNVRREHALQIKPRTPLTSA
jgi:hypothetical protein